MNKIIITIGLALTMAVPFLTHAQSTNSPSPATPSPSVREVASHPAKHLGPLKLLGVVGIVTPGKGFVLVDMKEYEEEGFGCLTTDEPTKISIEWAGAAPKVKEKVRVAGKLVKEQKGYAFIAEKVTKP